VTVFKKNKKMARGRMRLEESTYLLHLRRAVFAGTILIYVTIIIVSSLSLSPLKEFGWLVGSTWIDVRKCDSNKICEPIREMIHVKINPFLVSNVYSDDYSRRFEFVRWESLDSLHMCSGVLFDSFSKPIQCCASDGTYTVPKEIKKIQVDTTLAICLSIVSCLILCIVFFYELQRYGVDLIISLISMFTAFIFYSVNETWTTFPLSREFLNGDGHVRVLPIWNHTIDFIGPIIRKNSKEETWERYVYNTYISNEIIPTETIFGRQTGTGYHLWIAGVILANIATVMTISAFILSFSHKRQLYHLLPQEENVPKAA
jgi:hypothetical protein